MVNAIIMVRSSLSIMNETCATLHISEAVVKNIGTVAIYNHTIDEDEEIGMNLVDDSFFNV